MANTLRSDDNGSGRRKHSSDRPPPHIDRVGSPYSGDRAPPLALATAERPAFMVNRDIGGPLPRSGSAPEKGAAGGP